MSKFFNPKEDIFDIQLTSYGRHLMSKGEFSPKYYAFYDDDILYDSQFTSASIGEHQNDIQDRILNETPRMKSQTVFSGVETDIKRAVELVKHNKATIGSQLLSPLKDKHFVMPLPLGSSTLSNNLMPSWDAFFLKGELLKSTEYLSSSMTSHIKVPQIECEIVYTAKPFPEGKKVPATLNVADMATVNPDLDSETIGMWGGLFDDFDDGTRLKIYKDSIILEINERNTDYISDNFEIEVYEIASVTGSLLPSDLGNKEYEEFIPLSFASSGMADLGTAYLTDESSDLEENFPEVDSSYVEYFFEINVDREIDQAILCAHLPSDKARRKSLTQEIKCPDQINNLFSADLDKEEVYTPQIDTPPEDCD